MKPILIIKTGSASGAIREQHGDFDAMVAAACGLDPESLQVVSVRKGEPLPEPEAVSGAILTGSPAMVTDREPWSVALEHWVVQAQAAGVPLLGICYGHQLLAQAFGGEVIYHPGGMELGTVEIRLTEAGTADALLGQLPALFLGHVIHSQTVKTLPPGAVRLACNGFDENHAFRLGDRTWGVQFHPEFTAGVIRDYLVLEARESGKSEAELEPMLAGVREHDHGRKLLEQFCSLVSR